METHELATNLARTDISRHLKESIDKGNFRKKGELNKGHFLNVQAKLK